jgi:translation initiation factor 1
MDITLFNSSAAAVFDSKPQTKIHIRIQQRSTRQSLTLLEGLDSDLDLDRICKYMRKAFNCNGTVLEGSVISLQGDQRENIAIWLVEQEVLTKAEAKERLVIHGF